MLRPATTEPICGSEVSVRQRHQALAAAKRWQVLHSGWQHERRGAERLPFEEIVTLVRGLVEEPADAPSIVAFKGWGFNISDLGLCCVTNSEVLAFWPGERHSAFVPLRDLVRRGRRLTLGIPAASGQPLWIDGDVVRTRSVHDELFEMGVKFASPRIELPDAVRGLLARSGDVAWDAAHGTAAP